MADSYGWSRALAILAILVILLFLLSLVAGNARSGGEQKSSATGPTGSIFISGTDNARSPFLKTLIINVADGTRVQLGEDDVSLGNFYAFSRDNSFAVFVGITKDRLDAAMAHRASPGDVTQVYRASVAPHVLPLPAQGVQLTNDDSPNKSMPAISDDGRLVAYVGASSSMPSATCFILAI